VRHERLHQCLPVRRPKKRGWCACSSISVANRWRQTANRERLDRSSPPREVESNPEAALVARSVVWRALATLDPRRRAVLVMHELEGVPVDVIARTLGVTAVTVRWHLSKGRRQLAAAIRGAEGHRELGEGRTS
jgi:RNA polymerase sigma-70 factor (ECF subfamily)